MDILVETLDNVKLSNSLTRHMFFLIVDCILLHKCCYYCVQPLL